jgi:hypothetical protein
MSGSTRPAVTRGRVITAVTLTVLLAVIVAIVALPSLRDPFVSAPADEVQPDIESSTFPLTGLPADVLPEHPALLVKVSNSPEARPQTGLDRADVVFEELTEGGVTRFIAVFHSQLPDVVGPVRSARPVDAQVMSGFGYPGFAYSGARAEVRSQLALVPAAALTEGAPGFFRDAGQYASHPVAPHNLFLRTEETLRAAIDAGAQPLGDLGWVFDENSPDGAGPGETVSIGMSESFTTTWHYESSDGRYRRQQNGLPSAVTGSGQIGAANVVVLDVRHYVGASGYPETDVLGTGPAVVLRDGERFAARWSKPQATEPLLILTADGAATFPLKPGPTWIHLPDRLPD